MGDPITDWLNSYKIPTHKVRQAGGDLVKSIGSKIRDKYRQLPDIPKRSMGAPGLGFSRPSIAKMDTFIEQRQNYYINTAREKPDDSPDLRNSFPNKVAELFRGQTMDTLSQQERNRINKELARWPVYLQQQALDMVKTGTVYQPTRQDLKKDSYDNEVEYTLPGDVLEAYKATQMPTQDPGNLMDFYEDWIQPFAKWMAPQQQKYIPKEVYQTLQAIRYLSTLGQYAEENAERDERRWAGREEITELYEEYRDEGLSEYEAAEKAYDEVDLPKGDKLIQEFIYDPLWLVGAKPVTMPLKVAVKGAIKTPTVIRAAFPAMKAVLSKQGLLNLPKKGETIITSIPSGIVKAAKGLPEIPEKIGKIITEKRLQAYKPVPAAVKEPWQMARDEFVREYEELHRLTTAAEKTPSRKMTPEEVVFQEREGWEAYSRQRGYTEKEIADFDRFTILSTKKYPQEYARTSDIHQEHIVKALAEGKPVPDEVLRDYPNLAKAPAKEAEKEASKLSQFAKKLKAVEAKIDKQKELIKTLEARAGKQHVAPGSRIVNQILDAERKLMDLEAQRDLIGKQFDRLVEEGTDEGFELWVRSGEKQVAAKAPVDPATLIPKLGNEAYDTAMFKTAADFDDPEKVLAALAQIRNKALTERKGYIDAAIEAGEVLPEFVDDAGKGFKVVPAEAITNAGKKAAGILQVTTPGGKIPVDPGWKWIVSETLDGIPGIRNVRSFFKPALKLVKTKSGIQFLTAHIAKNGVVSMLKTQFNGDSIILLHALETVFGPGSLKGNKITGINKDGRLWVKLKPDDTMFSPELHPLGKKGGRRFSTREFTSKDGVEYEKVNTLFDVLQRPWLYALDANQIKVVRYFHQFHTDHLIKVNGEYKLGIKLFTPKGKDAAYVPNMDVSTEAKHLNDILQDIGNAGLTREQFKTRYYNSGFDRWWHNPKFVPETNIRTLDAGLNSSKVEAVGKQIYRDLLGGKTKMDVFDELHPKLKALKLSIAKSLKKAKGRSERLLNNTQKFQIVNKVDSDRLKRYKKAIKQLEGEGKLWHTDEPGYYSSEQGAQQWMQLNGKLAVLRDEASIIEKRLLSVKKPTESIAKEQELLLKEIEYLIEKNTELSKAYSTAGLGDYVLVKDQGLYRYFKADEAKAVTQLLDTTNNGFIKFIENIRRTAFVADLSPIFGVQGPLHLFASPVQTTLDWVRGFRKGISQGDIFSAFDEKRLAMDIIENPESYREFAFYNGIELAGATPNEFAIGYLSKIRFKGIGDKLAKKNEQLFSGMLRETRNLFNRTAKSLIEDGADPVQAKAVAATIAKSVNPMWDPFALGLSTKRAQQIRVLATSVSFITKPATLTKDAVMFMMKVGTKGSSHLLLGSAGTVHLGEITRREKQAFKILLNITMSTNAIAILSSTISALAQGKDVEEAVNEVVDPRSGKFMSIVIGDRRIPIGGPYRSIIKAMVPRDRINLMGGQSIKLPVPVPFAGVPGFFFNRITPAVKTQLDVLTNKDFYGDPIWRGAWYEALARAAAYEVSGALPLTAAEFIRGPLSHHSIDDVTEQAAAQFFGVNLFQETPFQRRNEKVQEWAEEKRLPEIESYYDLAPSNRMEFDEQFPEIKEKIEKENKRRVKLGNERALRALRSDELRKKYRDDQLTDDQAFQANQISPDEWLQRKKLRAAALNAARDQIYEGLDVQEPKTPTDLYYQKLDELAEINGGFLNNKAWREMEYWIKDLSSKDQEYINKNTKLTPLTPLLGEYNQALTTLEPYWDILEKTLARFPGSSALYHDEYQNLGSFDKRQFLKNPRNMLLHIALQRVELEKRIMRETNKKIDDEIIRWYGGTPRHPMNLGLKRW